jgi:hypothetical protein
VAPPSPIFDHIVIDVRDRIDEAAQRFAQLGFQLTSRGHHTLGSSNHLALFATDYLELLGFGAGGASRAEIQPFPIERLGVQGRRCRAHLPGTNLSRHGRFVKCERPESAHCCHT